DLSKCRENLGDLARRDFDHDDISRPGRIPALLNGEGLRSPIQHLPNSFDLALRNMPGQIGNDSDRPPGDDFTTLADLNAVQRFHRMDLGAESATARGIESIALELQLHLRPHSLH